MNLPAMIVRRRIAVPACVAALLAFGSLGCSDDAAEREKQIREGAAKAAEAAKPPLEEAGRDIKAAVEGAKEGWDRAGNSKRVDLNSASEGDLTSLPGVGKHEARKIISGRPYRDKHDLVTKKVMSESAYARLKDAVVAK